MLRSGHSSFSSRVVAAAAALLLVAARSFAGPVGAEFGINDRPLPPKLWWTSCTDASGRRATLVHDCTEHCDEKEGNLFFQRYDADGDAIGTRTRVNEEAAWLVGFRVACSDTGWVSVQWKEGECYRHRAFNPSSKPAGAPTAAESSDCRTRPNVAVASDGDMVAAWPDWLPSAGSQIRVQRFHANGEALGPGVQVSEAAPGARVQPKVSIDENGNAFVAWLGETDSAGHGPVVGRFVASSGVPAGEAFQIDTFGFGPNSDPAVRALDAGEFEVAWNNPLEGGRIAREVHAGASASLAVPHAPSAAAPALPDFGAPRVLDSPFGGAAVTGRLETGSDSVWIYSDAGRRHWRTENDSTTWSPSFGVSEGSHERETIGDNGEGVWVALRIGEAQTIDVSRSTDDGATWSNTPASILSPKAGYHLSSARVHGAGDTWVAAWSLRDGDGGQVVVARSVDGGITWGTPDTILTGDDYGRLGFELATNGDGTWLLMLADEGIRFLRSGNDGASWSSPPAIVEEAYCPTCATSWRYSRVSLTSDDDRWMAVFAAPLVETDTFGRDGDVYVLRSDDDGASWSAPAAIAAHASADGSPDFSPALATDGSGRWLAAWVSHHPGGDGDGLDSDVFLAVSTNFGATWSSPALLADAMSDDEASDAHVVLSATTGGRWLAAWRRTGFAASPFGASDEVMVAAADASCGNDDVEIGESCDDGQLGDGDGCDSNCTPTGCGNGVVTAGEECDDGDRDQEDGCSTSCREPFCGDGIVSPSESCDDGNTVDTDGCPNHCYGPRCGDGITQEGIEECDSSGYSSATCTPECKHARCGDGYLAPRAEACDDGNQVDDDACPNDCSRAICGMDGRASDGRSAIRRIRSTRTPAPADASSSGSAAMRTPTTPSPSRTPISSCAAPSAFSSIARRTPAT